MIRACFGVVPPPSEGCFDVIFGTGGSYGENSLCLDARDPSEMLVPLVNFLISRGCYFSMAATDVLIDERVISKNHAYYRECARQLALAKKSVASYFGTSLQDSFLGFCRTWENLPWLLENAFPMGVNKRPFSPRDTSGGVVVVCSGPSLDVHRRALAKCSAVMLVADSAVSYMREIPKRSERYMVAIERTAAVEKYFSDENLASVDGVVVSSFLTPYCLRQIDKCDHLRVVWLPQDCNLMRSVFPGKRKPLNYGKSVASASAAFALNIGMQPAFVGLDLCYAGSGHSHASGIVTGQKNRQTAEDVISVDGIATTPTWVSLARDIERICSFGSRFGSGPESMLPQLPMRGLSKASWDFWLSPSPRLASSLRCPLPGELLLESVETVSRERFACLAQKVRVDVERVGCVADMLEIPNYCLVLGDVLAPAIVPLTNLSQFKASEDFAFQKLRALSLATCDKIEAFLLAGENIADDKTKA